MGETINELKISLIVWVKSFDRKIQRKFWNLNFVNWTRVCQILSNFWKNWAISVNIKQFSIDQAITGIIKQSMQISKIDQLKLQSNFSWFQTSFSCFKFHPFPLNYQFSPTFSLPYSVKILPFENFIPQPNNFGKRNYFLYHTDYYALNL